MKDGVTAASGTGRGLVRLPSPALLTEAQFTMLLNYVYHICKGVTGMADELKTTYIGY